MTDAYFAYILLKPSGIKMAGGSRRVLPTKAVVTRRSVNRKPRRRAVSDMRSMLAGRDAFRMPRVDGVMPLRRVWCAVMRSGCFVKLMGLRYAAIAFQALCRL